MKEVSEFARRYGLGESIAVELGYFFVQHAQRDQWGWLWTKLAEMSQFGAYPNKPHTGKFAAIEHDKLKALMDY